MNKGSRDLDKLKASMARSILDWANKVNINPHILSNLAITNLDKLVKGSITMIEPQLIYLNSLLRETLIAFF